MGGWTSFLVRKVIATYPLGKLAALCLLTPFATSFILPSFHTLAELWNALLDYIDQPLIATPAFIFLMCNLIVLAIIITSIMGHPHTKTTPYNFLPFPFKPIETISFTSHQYKDEAPPLSEDASCIIGPTYSKHCPDARSSAAIALHHNASSPTVSTVARSKIGGAPTDNLTDEEVNQRFTAFIEYRFATMKKEMMD